MEFSTILDQKILPQVDKPSRYLGVELNAVRPEDKKNARVRLALIFPDLYDLGLGNLGIHILYKMINRQEHLYAERAFAPGLDMERLLRAEGLPMFSLESKAPLGSFDGLGFTLQSELTYTNILNIIDLAGMALRTKDRAESDPLTFAGGPAVFNPEPLAPFMDFFVIGDGEDVVLEVGNLLDRVKGREARLDALAELEGVYVPARYPMETLPDGRILPPVDGPKIRKRVVSALSPDDFPVDYIVPFTRQVHDRVSLEVLRGCTQGCRFCQAGMTTRPVRERTPDQVVDLMDKSLQNTGYEEVSLVSLSTCDHSQVRQMVDAVVQKAEPKRVGVSLPSLRLDSFSVDVADMVAGIRRTGLTFAPEAASPRLRAVINKWIPDEKLLQMSGKAYSLGWDHVKLYFMIGLPTERDDDIEAIADLTLRTLEMGRQKNRKARVHTGVSTFVPKPFTPFQWAEQLQIDETERRQRILSERFYRNSGVKFGRHDPAETMLEGMVSRADRRAGDVIEAAFRLGARFDAWGEHLDIDVWYQAAESVGFDVEREFRERALDERLPWDHIDIAIPKSWFVDDYKRAMQLEHAEDCRHKRCHRCGVIDEHRELCASMLRDNIEGRKSEAAWEERNQEKLAASVGDAEVAAQVPGAPPSRRPEPPPVQRLVFRIGVTGSVRFLSHLETMNAWLRALRRADLPVAYSQGFHPHPKVAFAGARPLFEQTVGDFMDVVLNHSVEPEFALACLREKLPEGFFVYAVTEVPLKAPSLMSQVAVADYLFRFHEGGDVLDERVAGIWSSKELLVERKAKKKRKTGRAFRRKRKPNNGGGMRTIDLRPHLERLEVRHVSEPPESGGVLAVSLSVVEGRGAKPTEIIRLLGFEPIQADVFRLNTRFYGVLGDLLNEPPPMLEADA